MDKTKYTRLIEIYKEFYDTYKDKAFDITKWFKFSNENMRFICSVDHFLDINVYLEHEITNVLTTLECDTENINFVPDYIFLGHKNNKEKALLKLKYNDFCEVTDEQIDLLIKTLNYLFTIYENEFEDLEVENKNLWYLADFNDKTESYAFEVLPFEERTQFLHYPLDFSALDYSKFKDEGSMMLDAFFLEMPVYSKKSNKIINPLLIEIGIEDKLSYIVTDCEGNIGKTICEYLNTYDSLPKNVDIFNFHVYSNMYLNKGNNEINLNTYCYEEHQRSYNMTMHNFLMQKYEYDFLANGFIDLSDLEDLFNKIIELNTFVNNYDYHCDQDADVILSLRPDFEEVIDVFNPKIPFDFTYITQADKLKIGLYNGEVSSIEEIEQDINDLNDILDIESEDNWEEISDEMVEEFILNDEVNEEESIDDDWFDDNDCLVS